MKNIFHSFFLLCVCFSAIYAQSAYPVIPKPNNIKYSASSTRLEINESSKILIDPKNDELTEIGNYISSKINNATGYTIAPELLSDFLFVNRSIILKLTPNKFTNKEAYTLNIDSLNVTIEASTPQGIFYGTQTLLQLMSPKVESKGTALKLQSLRLPMVSIRDEPNFVWRGMHLDVSRHFFPTIIIKRYIDYLAMHKINVFHWHLSDDQGWRIEIKKYPKLTKVGAWRDDRRDERWYMDERSRKKIDPAEPKYGGFYTQEDIKEIVQYAKSKYIDVLPELDFPGHSQALLAAYPEYSCSKAPRSVAPAGLYEFSEPLDPSNGAVYQLIDDIYTEVAALFPFPYIHVGGDEANRKKWANCASCTALMKTNNLKNYDELQSYFLKRVQKIIEQKGRTMIGWDEVMEGGLPEKTVVMAWRNYKPAIDAANMGKYSILAPTTHCYFDNSQDEYKAKLFPNVVTLEKVYNFSPMPYELNGDAQKYILGGQACLWTEEVQTPEVIEEKVLPRMCALAEALWTKPENKNYYNFKTALMKHYERLDMMHTNYYVQNVSGLQTDYVFMDKIKINLDVPDTTYKVVYTIDGSEPSYRSQRYRGVITISADVVLNVKAYLSNGKELPTLTSHFTKLKPTPAVAEVNIQPGIRYTYYEGNFLQISDILQKGKMIKSGVQNDISIPKGSKKDYIGLIFEGFVDVPTDGRYVFNLYSDDGSKLMVDNKLLIDNDGIHGNSLKQGQAVLKKGLHPITLFYFENSAGEVLMIDIEKPDGTIQKLDSKILKYK
ncbi:MAG: family 20 glycosylhydrolase [Cytophagales bacterium]|nr:family 20 glycosylhydrolase [Cytophagales bacterium]